MRYLTLLLALHISGCAGAIAAMVKLPFVAATIGADANGRFWPFSDGWLGRSSVGTAHIPVFREV